MRFLFFVILSVLFLACPAHSQNRTFQVKNAVAKKTTFSTPVIDFQYEVSEDSASWFLLKMQKVNKDKSPYVVVILNTPGGSVYAGQAISKSIEDSSATVICVVDGMAASMGAYILASCDIRVMTKRSVLMYHEPAVSMSGQSKDLRTAADMLDADMYAMAEHICSSAPKLSVDELVSKIKGGKEWWVNWQEAMDKSLVDFTVKSYKDVLLALESVQ